jgi:hypothetical protein
MCPLAGDRGIARLASCARLAISPGPDPLTSGLLLTKEMVEKKYPRGDAPEYVFSNETTTVSIAAGYTPNANLTIEQLPQFKEFMEKNFERLIAGVEWITRGFKEIRCLTLMQLLETMTPTKNC